MLELLRWAIHWVVLVQDKLQPLLLHGMHREIHRFWTCVKLYLNGYVRMVCIGS